MEKLDKKNIEDILSLTPMQEGMLFHYLKAPERLLYFEQLSLNISGEIDVKTFKRAWNVVIETNEMLRTVFRWEKVGNPVQIILKKHQLQPKFYDLSGKESREKKNWVEKIKVKDREEKFDLREVPFRVTLCKIQETNYEMIISNHHILYDGWSNGIILKEFFNTYADLIAKRTPVKPAKTSFKAFIQWIQNQDKEKQEVFWKEYLAGIDGGTKIPVKRKSMIENRRNRGGTGNYFFTFKRDRKAKMEDIIRIPKITIASLFYVAWVILLQKYTNRTDVIFGTTLSGRSAKIKGIEEVVGLFINTLPLRVHSNSTETFQEMLMRTNDALKTREAYETTSLADIKQYCQWDNNEEIFDCIVVIENYPLDTSKLQADSPLMIGSCSIMETSHYDLAIVIQISDTVEFNLIYNDLLYDERSIRQLASHFVCITRSISETLHQRPDEIEILSSEEKQRLLVEFNNTTVDYPKHKTIHQLFVEQAGRTPDHIAVVESREKETMGLVPLSKLLSVTYEELNRKSNQLALMLKAKGVKADAIVGIIVERSLEMITGILGILKAGGAYLPIDVDYPEERINHMLKDCSTDILLVQPGIIDRIGFSEERLYLDCTFSYHQGKSKSLSNINKPFDLAYVMYTSGSTGRPKGVMVEHQNVVRLVKNIDYVPLTEETRILQTGAPVFDATTFEVWGPLLNGGRLVLTGKEVILDAHRLGKALTRHRINTLWLSVSLFNQLEQQNNDIFSPLSYLLVGGDVLSPPHINRVRGKNKWLKVVNGYGPTENTTFSTTYLIEKDFEFNISIGSPISNSYAYILDRNFLLQPIGVYGELCVGGDGLSRGYLNSPQLTTERFIENPFDAVRGERLYRTGDLARWLEDGNIEIAGRIDRQVKVRGFRVELGEIESCLLRHKTINEAIIIVRMDDTGDKYLCAYFVSNQEVSSTELRVHLTKELPRYMIPSYYIRLDRMPLTTNGKIDRRALPTPELEAAEAFVAPRNPIEEKLTILWAELLGMGKKRINIDDDFFQLGGHSLKATRLASMIHKEFNIHVPLQRIFESSTIRDLAKYIGKSKKRLYSSIELSEKKEYYMLSSAQRRLYFLQQFHKDAIAYNISIAWIMKGDVDKAKPGQTFRKLIQRHESLRTSIKMKGEEPVQFVHDDVKFDIEFFDFSTEVDRKDGRMEGWKGGKEVPFGQVLDTCVAENQPSAALINSFIQPFDLSQAPLLRVGLIKMEEAKHLLIVDMHHIITDGTSQVILTQEFMALYENKREELLPIRLQYKDFAQWRNIDTQRETIKKQEEYWKQQFEGEIPILHLPADYSRPTIQSFEGGSIVFEIREKEVAGLNQLALAEGTTLYMVLLAFYTIFLAKITNQEDIVVGTPVAGRSHVDLQQIIGMFVNTFGMRNYPGGEKTFTGFLQEVKERTLEAFENQDYPFEDLVEKVVVNRDAGRNPLFDTMFVLQNIGSQELKIPGLKLSPYQYEYKTAKFDLTLVGEEIGDKLLFTFEYSTKLFKPETIEGFIEYFKKIASVASVASTIKISEIEIVSEEERQQILFAFNETYASYPPAASPIQLFEAQVKKTPGKAALVSPSSSHQLTYRELNERSNCLGWLLREKGVGSDCIVGLMVERSLEMLVGILGIMKAGGAYLPIDVDYPPGRVNYMLKDSQSPLLLTRTNLAESFNFKGESIYIEEACSRGENSNPGIINNPQDMVYMIYTSGSTGKPKGAMVKIEGFLNLLHWYIDAFEIGVDANILLLAPISFDLAQKNLFGSHISGGRLTLAPAGIPDYHELSEIIRQEQVTMLNCAPSVFYPLIEFNRSSGFTRLKSLRWVILGGEPILADQLLVWVNSESCNCEIVNTYGPTECTDIASSYRIPGKLLNTQRMIPIGKPIHNVKIFILDKYLGVLPVKIAGELCIGGIGLSKGYHNNMQLTAEKFVETAHLPEKKVYRTGDLARWLPDGTIEFLGRLDHQVKVRGFRIELGEVESELLRYKEIKDAVVVVKARERGDNYLCAYIVSVSDVSVTELRDYLSNRLPGFMIPSYFTFLEKLPLTPNGKIDRRSLPEPKAKAGGEYIAPRDEIEEELVTLWSDVLSIEGGKISIYDNFFELGGHSLKATLLVSKIHRSFDVEVPLPEIFKNSTIRGLSEYIKEGTEYKFTSIEILEKKEYYMLSSAQKRLYLLKQMQTDEADTAYNMPSLWIMEGNIEKNRLKQTFKQLIQRHDSLRTSFHMLDEVPVQLVHDDVKFEIEYYNLTTGDTDKENYKFQISNKKETKDHHSAKNRIFHHSFVRSFDLSQAPLLRVGLAQLEEEEYLLMVDMHHIISDAVSLDIFTRDFMALYAGEVLPGLRIYYKDYSYWQNREKDREKIKRQEDFWTKEFAGEIPVLDLFTDHPRPALQSFEGKHLDFLLDEEKTRALKKIAMEEDSTIYMVLMAIFNILLAKISGQKNIVVGTPVAGRRHTDVEQIVGMLVNTLALRNYPSGEKRFRGFLREVRQRTLAALENQDYQFEDLVEKVVVNRDLSRNPLFDVMFVLQNAGIPGIHISGLKLRHCDYETGISKFDLTFDCEEVEERLIFTVEFNTKLFLENTIHKFINYFKKIVSGVLDNKDIRIWGIEILSEKEQRQLLFDFNDTAAPYPKDQTIHQLFAEQVERTPDHTALLGSQSQTNSKGAGSSHPFGDNVFITYRELNQKTNQLAIWLRSKGVKPDTIVGIMVERSLQVIIGILGILKSGGAYLPIDLSFPQERNIYMLRNSDVRILFTSYELTDKVNGSFKKVDLSDKTIFKGKSINLKNETHPGNLAYNIYTSGSTGKPKGVMIQHQSLVNFIKGITDIIDFTKTDSVLSLTTISFDIFGLETLLPLVKGSRVIIGVEEEQLNAEAASRAMTEKAVTILQLTPSRLSLFLSNQKFPAALQALKYLLVGGEALPEQLLEKTSELVKGKIYNMYGPTETTIWSTVKEVSRGKSLNIGKPIANTQIYILGQAGTLQPVGITGELYIGGDGLARGYLNRPELTFEKFCLRRLRTLFKKNVPVRETSAKTFLLFPSPLYQTGDLARWLPDGNIEFLGRIDHQEKIRGFRIEPGEIENQLLNHPEIKEAVVLARSDDTTGSYINYRDKYLCAYIVSNIELEISELRQYLSRSLPDYMLPTYFMQIDKIPLTPNGKIDRKALSVDQGLQLGTGVTYVPPETEIEKVIAQIWQEVLKREDKVGMEDNFFDLGGDSLRLVQLNRKLNKALETHIPVMTMFRYPTIQAFMRYLNRQGPPDNVTDREIDEALSIMDENMGILETVMEDEK